jgi:nicotinamidase-related amidase
LFRPASAATLVRMDTTLTLRPDSVLLLVDVQQGFHEKYWGRRDNPGADANMASLVGYWTAAGRPLVRIRHASVKPDSPLAPNAPGHAFQPVAAALEPALDVVKSVHSAFYGTPDLHAWLTERGAGQVVVAGIQTNMCCETTARMASELGYDVLFAYDATYTFDKVSPDGILLTAEELGLATRTTLDGDFARCVTTAELLAA